MQDLKHILCLSWTFLFVKSIIGDISATKFFKLRIIQEGFSIKLVSGINSWCYNRD
jgi:hypothetical protein